MRPFSRPRRQAATHCLVVLWAATQSPWRLPVTIEALQDVPAHVESSGGQKRGVLYVGRNETFTVKAGQRFRMVKIYAEGSCRIEFQNRQYDVSSCPWLDGFADQQTDIFRVVAGRRMPPEQ